MSTDAYNDLQGFHQFIGQQLESGQVPLSPDEALEAWRLQHRSPEEYAEDVEAIREALADIEAGEVGVPWETFNAEFRKRHNLDRE